MGGARGARRVRRRAGAGLVDRAIGLADADPAPPPLLAVTPEIAAAAALVAGGGMPSKLRRPEGASPNELHQRRPLRLLGRFGWPAFRGGERFPWGDDPSYKV